MTRGPRVGPPYAMPTSPYDHPFHAPLEHALNIDFVNEAQGTGARVAVELSTESARELIRAIQAALETGEGHHGAGGP